MRGRVAAAGALVVVLSLGACAESAKPAPTQATASEVAIYSSDSEALAAARGIYERYLKVGQDVSEAGGEGVDGFRPLLTSDAFAQEEKGAALLRDKKLTSTGATRLATFQLQTADLSTGHITAYACVDLSKVKVVNESGKDVTPKSRPNRQTFQPTFEWWAGRLLLKENGTWSGSSSC